MANSVQFVKFIGNSCCQNAWFSCQISHTIKFKSTFWKFSKNWNEKSQSYLAQSIRIFIGFSCSLLNKIVINNGKVLPSDRSIKEKSPLLPFSLPLTIMSLCVMSIESVRPFLLKKLLIGKCCIYINCNLNHFMSWATSFIFPSLLTLSGKSSQLFSWKNRSFLPPTMPTWQL